LRDPGTREARRNLVTKACILRPTFTLYGRILREYSGVLINDPRMRHRARPTGPCLETASNKTENLADSTRIARCVNAALCHFIAIDRKTWNHVYQRSFRQSKFAENSYERLQLVRCASAKRRRVRVSLSDLNPKKSMIVDAGNESGANMYDIGRSRAFICQDWHLPRMYRDGFMDVGFS